MYLSFYENNLGQNCGIIGEQIPTYTLMFDINLRELTKVLFKALGSLQLLIIRITC